MHWWWKWTRARIELGGSVEAGTVQSNVCTVQRVFLTTSSSNSHSPFEPIEITTHARPPALPAR